MSVTFARGFRAAGVTAGMKPSGRPDLGLLVADESHSAAGLFTTNAFAAAPVRLSRHRISRGRGRAVLVNSGQANAGTGLSGDGDAEHSTAAVAELLGIEPDEVLACSTGLIGEQLIHVQRLADDAGRAGQHLVGLDAQQLGDGRGGALGVAVSR